MACEDGAVIDPFVSIDWLRSHLDAVVVADCRWYLDGRSGRAAYDAGHVPGAVFVDLDTALTRHADPADAGRHPLAEPADFAAAMGALGIGDDDTVIAYDDAGGVIAARLVWMLRATGREAALLDGGLDAWDGELATAPAVRAPDCLYRPRLARRPARDDRRCRAPTAPSSSTPASASATSANPTASTRAPATSPAPAASPAARTSTTPAGSSRPTSCAPASASTTPPRSSPTAAPASPPATTCWRWSRPGSGRGPALPRLLVAVEPRPHPSGRNHARRYAVAAEAPATAPAG